jgi:hypothetical protein
MENTKAKSKLKKVFRNFGEDEDTHNTQHTIISTNVFDKLGNNRSVGEWIFDAVNGDVGTYGLELLD